MEISIKTLILVISILFTGLTAGLCFTWSNAVTPGIGRLNDFAFLQSLQAMNRAIINRSFLIVFFSPVLLLFLNVFLFKNAGQTVFWSFLWAAVFFFLGVALVTIFKNVPLNELLDNTVLETATKVELADLRKIVEKPWNQWHMMRTVSSFIAFALLITGMLQNQ